MCIHCQSLSIPIPFVLNVRSERPSSTRRRMNRIDYSACRIGRPQSSSVGIALSSDPARRPSVALRTVVIHLSGT